MNKKLFALIFSCFLALLSQFALQAQNVPATFGASIKATVTTNCTGCILFSVTNTATGVVTTDANGTVNFNIPAGTKRISAGVFDANNQLVRTLFSGDSTITVGKLQWDGLLDDQTTQAAFGSYTIKVLTSATTYTWEGGVGNTTNRNNINVGFSGIASGGLAATSTVVGYGESFSEGHPGSKTFSLSDVNNISYINTTAQLINAAVATDGVNFYWAGRDDYTGDHNNQTLNAIFATKVSDNSPVQFSSGVTYNTGQANLPYNYFIGTNLAVESYSDITQAGNLLIAPTTAGNIVFFSKSSGAVIKSTPLGSPYKIAAGSANELWVLDGSTKVATKYSIDNNQNLTSTGITIANLSNPKSIKLSPDNSTVALLDAGTQQIKFYSNVAGALQSTFGQLNGYAANGPLVQDDKFNFGDNAQFAYQPDGSFWVTDDGLHRLAHIGTDGKIISQSMYVPGSTRCVAADPNDPTRVFSDLREYKVDYSKPLDNGTNGSWKLYRYWGTGVDAGAYGGFTRVVTLPNGYTYAKGQGSNLYVLDNTAGARLVNANFYGTLEDDGSIYDRINNNNQFLNIVKSPLISTANDGTPAWGASQVIAATPAYTRTSPFFFYNSDNVIGNSTNSSRIFFFNPWRGSIAGLDVGFGYHLAGIKIGEKNFNWQASKSTNAYNYGEDYPRNGDFDIGNNDFGDGTKSVDCQALINGSNIFWNVNAEFWRTNYIAGNGVSIWNHFNEDGLLIGNFGVTSSESKLFLNNAGNSGNGFCTALVKVGADYYIYFGDESQWCWAHRYKVSGLNTIAEQSIPITITKAVTITADPADMMTGLPDGLNENFTGDNRWTIEGGTATIGRQSYIKGKTDISIAGNTSKALKCDLKNTGSLQSWTISGLLNFGLDGQATINSSPTNAAYLDVVDVNGKIIMRYYDNSSNTQGTHQTYVNSVVIKQGSIYTAPVYPFAQLDNKAFTFKYSNGTLSFTYQYYNKGEVITKTITAVNDSGANAAAPAYLRASISSEGRDNRQMVLSRVRFVKN